MAIEERLDAGDFEGARAAWQEQFGAGQDDLVGSWELAEVEERWGDALFFGEQVGAGAHYQEAQHALFPPGVQFTSREENDRRTEAFGRVTDKLYAIDSSGCARAQHSGQPHPNFKRIEPPAAVPTPSKEERLAAVMQARDSRELEETEFARRLQDADHWRWHSLGDQWCDAGRALAAYPAAARRAFAWSLHYFEKYNRAWTAHLPASRWDSDGGGEMLEVQELIDGLGTESEDVPEWVEALLAGDWSRARSAIGKAPPSAEFQPLEALLTEDSE